jgi:hypothetical protein
MKTFDQLQRDAVVRFLQTVLIVDDRAYADGTPRAEKSTVVADLVDPAALPEGALPLAAQPSPTGPLESGQLSDPPILASLPAQTEQLEVHPPPEEESKRRLDIKRLADLFADLGLTCGVLKPEQEERVVDRIVKVATRADIVVLDWWLGDGSEDAVEAIRRLVSAPYRSRRLVAVYTTYRGLGSVMQAIKETVADWTPVADSELSIDVNGVRVTVFAKGETKVVEEWKDHVKSIDELPAALVDIFVDLATGLVSAVALNALAAIRENTLRLLERLDCGLDVGYIAHFLRLWYAEDAAEHLVDAVADELRAVIEDDTLSWTDAKIGPGAWLTANAASVRITPGGIAALRESPCESPSELHKRTKEHTKGVPPGEERFSALLLPHERAEEARESDERFAMLMSLRIPYDRPAPILHLGTIVRETKSGLHWVCVQPVCDSVRLPGPTAFPMLALEEAQPASAGLKFGIVVRDETGSIRHLWNPGKPLDLKMMRFCPEGDGSVRFRPTQELSGNRATSLESLEFIWLAQLKAAHAQRIAHQLGQELTRVGLDESEWLRARAREGKKPPRANRAPAAEGPAEGAEDSPAIEELLDAPAPPASELSPSFDKPPSTSPAISSDASE